MHIIESMCINSLPRFAPLDISYLVRTLAVPQRSQMFQRLAKLKLQLPRGYEEVEKDSCCNDSDFEVKNDQSSNCVNWRERRAAVLICLFEGQEGELRVILTKRSMKLSSYPGKDFLIYTTLMNDDHLRCMLAV